MLCLQGKLAPLSQQYRQVWNLSEHSLFTLEHFIKKSQCANVKNS